MKWKSELFVIDVFTVLLVIVISFFPNGVLRIILGLPFIAFCPGYTLTAAIFPKISSISGIQRLALSIGLSLAIVPLIGLTLNYTTWGISVITIVSSIAFFILSMSIVALIRRRNLSDSEITIISWKLNLSSWTKLDRLFRFLIVLLVVVILAGLGSSIYVFNKPKSFNYTTEFYLLGSDGKADDYPQTAYLGDNTKIIIGIINQEKQQTTYVIKMSINGTVTDQIGPISLNVNQKWEHDMTLDFTNMGDNQRVEFSLFENGSVTSTMSTYLLINVQ